MSSEPRCIFSKGPRLDAHASIPLPRLDDLGLDVACRHGYHRRLEALGSGVFVHPGSVERDDIAGCVRHGRELGVDIGNHVGLTSLDRDWMVVSWRSSVSFEDQHTVAGIGRSNGDESKDGGDSELHFDYRMCATANRRGDEEEVMSAGDEQEYFEQKLAKRNKTRQKSRSEWDRKGRKGCSDGRLGMHLVFVSAWPSRSILIISHLIANMRFRT